MSFHLLLDVTTVLLVDNHGRSSLGRFLNVKPDLGLITSTARTFIQEGVTTEYATQVLGTTLDNGRLYAHLLTKSSRVLYDSDLPSRSYNDLSSKKWNIDNNLINSKNFVKNTDFISPNHVDTVLVFPTTKPKTFLPRDKPEALPLKSEESSEELLKSSSSNNPRVPLIPQKDKNDQNNIKVFKISPQMRDIAQEINNKENEIGPKNEIQDTDGIFSPSKVRALDNLPTFTVRNEFSPSGYSFLGDLPNFDINTERSKPTTAAERKAKFLFRAGLIKPEPKDLKTVTYSGFADFTTTVGDTVIIFSPHTTEANTPSRGQDTKITVEPTIEPTVAFKIPVVGTSIKTFVSHEPGMETKTVEGHKLNVHTSLPTMVIDASDRQRIPKDDTVEQHEDIVAKSSILAHEQKISLFDQASTPQIESPVIITSQADTTMFSSPEAIQPSESQMPMLSTPSDEDIAKIVASLQAKANQQATQPLNRPATIFFDEDPLIEQSTNEQTLGGATTIFFDDDISIQTTGVSEPPITTAAEEITTGRVFTTTEAETTTEVQETTEKLPETTEKPSTTTKKEVTTMEEETEPVVLSTLPMQKSTTPSPEENEEDDLQESDKDSSEETESECTKGSQIVPTTMYKTLTYLTTFFIPQDDSTITSIKSNEVVSTEVSYQTKSCEEETISPSPPSVIEPTTKIATEKEQKITTTPANEESNEKDENDEKDNVEDEDDVEQNDEEDSLLEPTTEHHTTTIEDVQQETTPLEITTERRHVTESEPEVTEMTTEEGDELELIFKTLYTTYTYLTTYFQDNTSSVASRIVVTTNVITSTIDPAAQASDPAVAGLLAGGSSISSFKSRPISFEDFEEIAPTSVGIGRPTESYENANGESGNDENALENYPVEATPALNDEAVLQTPNAIKTYYTTYTYFTTIFVDGETEISSRTEVYTNYVTPSIQPNVALENLIPTRIPDPILRQSSQDDDEDEEDEEVRRKSMILKVVPSNSYNSTINRQKTQSVSDNSNELYSDKQDNGLVTTSVAKDTSYVTLQRDAPIEDNILNLSEYETIATMVTDVRSSTSEGARRIIDNLDKRNVLLDDQIVSESNNDSEIIPSPTLLLQTSYTTFTYFTTMYHGTTSSDVISRLETVTNVVTETLTPTHSLSVEDLSLPITYFTTFTYWTTLYKDGSTKVTSREETVSNIVTPSAVMSTQELAATINPVVSTPIPDIVPTAQADIEPSSVVDKDNLTTYFTTYTYYTTSYVGDSTVLNSRLETVTNVVNNSAEVDSNQIGRAVGTAGQNQIDDDIKPSSVIPLEATVAPSTGLLSTIVSTQINSDTTTIFSTDVYGTYIDGLYAKVLESTSSIIEPTLALAATPEPKLKPTGVVSINQGKIVDADGISTLFYTTQAVGTYIDNLYAQVIESTSSLKVDEDKKATLATDTPVAHKTGLVRLIEGSIVQNDTTTLYQSKVLGTVIDGRYAQIIESTSSFIVGKPSIQPFAASDIAPTPTKAPADGISATTVPISPSPVVVEGSLSDSTKVEEESTTEENEEDDGKAEDGDDSKDGTSRSKSRLTFQTRKRTFTPVIRPFISRPTLALRKNKGGQSSATTITRSDFTPTVTAVPAAKPSRFGSRRSSASANAISPTASGSRRFSRPKSSSASGVGGFSRGRSSAKIQPTASFSSRRSGFRSSISGSPSNQRSSSSRYRIRPTVASSLNRSPNSITPPSVNKDEENDLTTQITENPTGITEEVGDTTLPVSTTTESSRRGQNPLLKFRRPPLSRPTASSKSTTRGKSVAANKNGNRATTTSTTAKPKTAYNRSNLSNRPRTNALFPRRNIFTTSTTTTPPPETEEEAEEEELEEEEDPEAQDEDEDTNYESSIKNTQTENPPQTTTPQSRKGRVFSPGPVQIRPFSGLRKRTKRESTYSRFRRPGQRTSTTPAPVKEEEPETEAPKIPSRTNRFSRNRGKSTTQAPSTTSAPTAKRISPSKASLQGRSQFTLREKDTTGSRPNFRRTSPKTTRTTQAPSTRPKAPRLRNNQPTEAPTNYRKSAAKSTTNNNRSSSRNNRGRQKTRSRTSQKDTVDNNFVLPDFDGTITVTHQIPTEITIPVVNGKITEYKNVITAKYSTEVVGPQQYSTSVNPLGKEVTILLSDATSVVGNGATEITQFVLNETPTTSIVFTPTYIRGRKTSFSHVIPSTAYGVEQVVNTIQPALAAQAPLANILLSQLLLGGLQPQNPLLNLQNPAVAPTPSTEYKTKTTTYVTTVTSETSTVIPLTFRGKEILTTIIDSSINVVTATEFLTDTIVVTPTIGTNQLNSLLVPLLLQQQQIQPPINPLLQQQPAGVISLNQDPPIAQAIFQESEEILNLADDNDSPSKLEDEAEQVVAEDTIKVTTAPKRKSSKRKPKKPEPTEPPVETSVITLYVSGRTPEEFSTVLSTVIIGDGAKKKREIADIPVVPSKVIAATATSTINYLDSYVMPAANEMNIEYIESSLPTESLESIIGDVSSHHTKIPDSNTNKPLKPNSPHSKKYVIKYDKATNSGMSKKSSGNFLA